jgi:ParB-like nuclease domain
MMQMKKRTKLSTRSDHPTAAKLELDKTFQSCPAEPGDEIYPNGIFEFNITRLLSFIEASADRYPIERVGVDDIPNYGSESLDEETIRTADLLRPILLAEISPGRFNLIDGHHRVAKARREGVETLPAHRVAYPLHVRFLTSIRAYEQYVEYWNGKLAPGR